MLTAAPGSGRAGIAWRLPGVLAATILAAACRTAPPVIAPPPTSVPAPRVEVVATPGATPVATPLPPSHFGLPVREDVRAPLVRVLLTVEDEPQLPEPGRRWVCVAGAEQRVLRGPLAAASPPARPAFQVGAFRSPENAAAERARLEAGGIAASTAAGEDGLHRVLALGLPGEAAEALATRLEAAGWRERRAVPPQGAASVELTGEGGECIQANEIRLIPLDPLPVRVGAKSVRGELLVRPGPSAPAIINVVNLEVYLRGVVPAEMGPKAFPTLEALKAQAVAARTYAIAHLGEHASEGYDLCDSQMCQVYGGAGLEHPLSDQAVRETASEIVTAEGKPIDAMYHSTCGGHTEDGGAVFAERSAPYLKAVECRGERELLLGAGASTGAWFGPLERLARVAESLARSLGVAAKPAALATALGGRPAGAGSAGLASAFGIADVSPLLHARRLTPEQELAEVLRLFRLDLPEGPAGAGRARAELALVVRLAQLAGALRAEAGCLVPGPGGVRLVNEKNGASLALGAAVEAWEREGERWRRNAVTAAAGSPALAWCAGATCPVVEIEPRLSADAASSWGWWARELALAEVAGRIGEPGLREVAVARRGVSGRALQVTLRTAAGTREMSAYAFRRALELPDTLFVILRRAAPEGERLRFLGRGWGHGVGMCQNGAFGLAKGGATYREILSTYYHGVEINRFTGEEGKS
ncbi:MAG: SpoIID/LytB domain-containing protein [Acidobacteriota bacterium]